MPGAILPALFRISPAEKVVAEVDVQAAARSLHRCCAWHCVPVAQPVPRAEPFDIDVDDEKTARLPGGDRDVRVRPLPPPTLDQADIDRRVLEPMLRGWRLRPRSARKDQPPV